MAEKRKGISKKLRFEVFKRDSFKCQYCGATSPDVLLEVDHIKPVKEGGKNNIDNLVTACRDCNSGKGARLLDDNTVLEKQRQQLEELNERRQQLEMMMKWREGLAGLSEDTLAAAQRYWEEKADSTLTEVGIDNLRKWIKKYPLQVVLDSIDASCSQYLKVETDEDRDVLYTHESVEKAFKYIPKICHIKTLQEEKPYMKDLFYIRGIVNNRMYCDKPLALSYLERAHLAGASIPSFKTLAVEARNWTEWRKAMEEYLEGCE